VKKNFLKISSYFWRYSTADELERKYCDQEKIETLNKIYNKTPNKRDSSEVLFEYFLELSSKNKTHSDMVDNDTQSMQLEKLQKKRNEQMAKYGYERTLGKRCCLGYSTFYIAVNGDMNFDQWCLPNVQTLNILDISIDVFNKLRLKRMKKCQNEFCHCNFNSFVYEDYLKSFIADKYPIEDLYIPPYLKNKK
jgi:hypothetical protein